MSQASLLAIDRVAQTHLELVDSVSGRREATLLGVIDATSTPMGARLLRRRLLAPLTDVERIRRRLDLVEALVVHSRLREQLKTELGQIGDIERLAVRASLRAATPRDLGALRDGLSASRALAAVLEGVADPGLRETLGVGERGLDCVPELAALLERALVARPPAQPKDGEIFKPRIRYRAGRAGRASQERHRADGDARSTAQARDRHRHVERSVLRAFSAGTSR